MGGRRDRQLLTFQVLHRDGRWRVPRATGVVIVARDITTEQELDDLEADFIATVSELRTPLNPVEGLPHDARAPGPRHPARAAVADPRGDGGAVSRLENLISGRCSGWPGIPSEAQQRVFQRLRRLGDHLRRPQGTGLGLAIAGALADRMGGSLDLDSAAGEGSTFALPLPLARPHLATVAPVDRQDHG